MPKVRTADGLSHLQRAFVYEYLKNGQNASQAYLAAGYAQGKRPTHTSALACRLLKNDSIRAAIARRAEEAEKASTITLDYVREEHKRLAGIAEAKGDLASATRNLELTGRTIAAYTDRTEQSITVIAAPTEPIARRAWLAEQVRLLDEQERAGTAIASRHVGSLPMPGRAAPVCNTNQLVANNVDDDDVPTNQLVCNGASHTSQSVCTIADPAPPQPPAPPGSEWGESLPLPNNARFGNSG
jgi:phage terminase small subunit